MKNEQKREILELLSELPQSEKRDKAIQTMKEQLSFVDIPFMCIDNDDFQVILSEEQLEVIAEELSDYITESGDFSEYLTLAEESAIEKRPDLFSNQCNI